MMNKKIDFIMVWVDGNDKKWIEEKIKFSDNNVSKDANDQAARYRDWDNLRYWFRGIEKFAPWVNKIHFVTCGQEPDWLNETNPKLHLVNHTDYIEQTNLPTFSSHPIELNLHKIDGLSEHFVYFNDDTFITREITKGAFFSRNGSPKYRAILNAIVPTGNTNDPMPGIYVNNTHVINRHFNKNIVIKENLNKWFNYRYGVNANLKTLLNLPYDGFTGMYFDHLPAPFLKSTFKEVWCAEPDLLKEVSSHRFRDDRDVNQYLMRAWQICKGDFEPINISKVGRAYFLPNSYADLQKAIESQRYCMICINDSENITNFNEIKRGIIESFEKILPEKSSFEK